MFDNKKRLRELRKRIRSHQGTQDAFERAMALESNKDRRSALSRDLRDEAEKVKLLESDLIVEEAQQFGIELDKPSWWLDDVDPDDPAGPPPDMPSLAGFLLSARR